MRGKNSNGFWICTLMRSETSDLISAALSADPGVCGVSFCGTAVCFNWAEMDWSWKKKEKKGKKKEKKILLLIVLHHFTGIGKLLTRGNSETDRVKKKRKREKRWDEEDKRFFFLFSRFFWGQQKNSGKKHRIIFVVISYLFFFEFSVYLFVNQLLQIAFDWFPNFSEFFLLRFLCRLSVCKRKWKKQEKKKGKKGKKKKQRNEIPH